MTEKTVNVQLEEDDFSLPTIAHIPELNAETMILFGKEKCGKTTILTELKDCLIIDTEQGSKKVKALAKIVPDDRGPVGKMQWLKKFGQRLVEEGKSYDYVAIDTLTEVNDWAEWSGTWRYMQSVQGKSFNRVKDARGIPVKGGECLDPTSDDYESVHTLPDGNGYRWSRNELLDIFYLFQKVARKCIIYICHIEDKFMGNKEMPTDGVIPKQLALTGKLREMLPRKVDAIGYIYNEKGIIKVNFTGSEEKLGGTRAKHLIGYNGLLEWDKIFI